MECPKCHKIISEESAVCPHCKKVLRLKCPNCGSYSQNAICDTCGYIILTKCSKCSKMVETSKEKCKCGFPTKTSLAYQECETDEFASLSVKFSGLKNIRRVLASKELYDKFSVRLNNLLVSQLKNIDGSVIGYGSSIAVNFNKELSLATSADKACRLALKIVNAFVGLNLNIIQELGTTLGLTVTIIKKNAENLLVNESIENNVKLLTVNNKQSKYLRGLQVLLDQNIRDCIDKNYKTDSLYSVEHGGNSLMFYEILLEDYVLPPIENKEEAPKEIKTVSRPIYSNNAKTGYNSFKVFDIHAKCQFEKTTVLLENFKTNRIVSIRGNDTILPLANKLKSFYQDTKIIYAVCTEEGQYKPWFVLEQLFRDYYNLSLSKSLIPKEFSVKIFSHLNNLLSEVPRKASTAEDARFGYMDDFCNFIKSLKDCTIIIDNFEFMDDTTRQTLELFFDNFGNIRTNFVFITGSDISLHSKLKGLLRTPLYTEYTILPVEITNILSEIKEDAKDFINSFYYEKIKDNFEGSLLYYDNALKFLIEKGIVSVFENKILLRSSGSVVLPADFASLYKARLKNMSKQMEASMTLAFSAYLGARLDFETLLKLGIKNPIDVAKILEEKGFASVKDNSIYINNYNLVKPIIQSSLKKEVETYICKTILATIGKEIDNTLTLLLMGKLGLFKEEYMLLWKNAKYSLLTGDFDAYLKNCLGFLSLVEHIKGEIPDENIENSKKEVYENILMSLYAYSPSKIYSIENVLLTDAIEKNDNEKISKLSNLMLQGALISANYTDAIGLLHNILSRMPNAKLVVDGKINSKFLLLSLVNVEILFNIGNLEMCVEIANNILDVIKPGNIESIKPANFSLNAFVEHILQTMRLAAFAKVLLLHKDFDTYFEKIKNAFNIDLPDKDCIIAIREFISGKDYVPSNVENATPFSKVIYLILQELTNRDYKNFAQNIYQAKLLASDLNEAQIEKLCDLLIAFAYYKIDNIPKASKIYNDVIQTSEKSAIMNIYLLANYFDALLKVENESLEEGLMIINDSLELLRKYENNLMFILFEKLFIKTAEENSMSNIDIEAEKQKLTFAISQGECKRLEEMLPTND